MNLENINRSSSDLEKSASLNSGSAEKCIDELIMILTTSKLNPSSTDYLQKKFSIASDLLNKTSNDTVLIQNLQLKSSSAKRYNFARRLSRVFRLVVAILLILLGFGMIIMPAPPYFEMFTLFYLNPNDGVTIMDVISLIVAFTGISLLISGLIKFNDGFGK